MSYVPDEPVIVMTATEARFLWQAARLNELRLKHRTGDTALYELLVKIYRVGLLEIRPAVDGNEPRQPAASEKSELTTVLQVARAAGLSPRTVRLHIENHLLPATKNGREWIITATDAETYVAARRKN